MTVLRIVDLKERIAISDDFSLEERKFASSACTDLIGGRSVMAVPTALRSIRGDFEPLVD